MKKIALAVALSAGLPAFADGGEEVVRRVCVACHATRFDKAPQLGDRTAWAPLIKRGQHAVTAHAWVGVRNMPPQGGDPSLSFEGFASAVAYMARQAGGEWRDPDAAMLERIRAEVKKHAAQGHQH